MAMIKPKVKSAQDSCKTPGVLPIFILLIFAVSISILSTPIALLDIIFK